MNDGRAGVVSLPVAALRVRAEARRRAEEIYNQLGDVVHRAMEEVQRTHGRRMRRLVLEELVKLEEQATVTGGDPS